MNPLSLRSLALSAFFLVLQSPLSFSAGPQSWKVPLSFSSSSRSWEAVRGQQPQGLDLTLSLPKDHFFQGEVIPATLTFSNHSKDPYSASQSDFDRSGRLGDITFHAVDENGQMLVDPLEKYYAKRLPLSCGGGGGSDADLGTWSMTIVANPWLRFDHPGTFELYALSTRVRRGAGSVTDQRYVEMVSNKVRITIEPRTAAQESAALTTARRDIAEGGDHPGEAMDILKSLDTPESRAELIPFLGSRQQSERISAELGLAASASPETAASEILEAIKIGRLTLAMDMPRYYATLKTSDLPGNIDIPQDQLNNLLGIHDQKAEADARRSVQAVHDALQELFSAARQAPGDREAALARAAAVEWFLDEKNSALRAEAVRHQTALGPDLEDYIINFRAGMGGTDFLPMLRKAASAPEYNWRALGELSTTAPDEARPLVLADMSRPTTLYLPQTWDGAVTQNPWLSLPRAPIPALTSILRSRLKSGNYGTYSLWFPVMDRYGTSDLLPDMIAIYNTNAGNWPCAVECSALRFWIRCDPKAGLAALAHTIHSRDRTHCYKDILTEVLLDQWTSSAVPLLLTELNDPDDDVMQSAVKVLMAKGDPSCAPAVVDALERISKGPGPDGSEPWDLRQHEHSEIAQDLLAKSDWKYSPEEKARLEHIARDFPVAN